MKIVLFKDIEKHFNLQVLQKLILSEQIQHPNPQITTNFRYKVETDPDLQYLINTLLEIQIKIINYLSEEQVLFYIKLLSDLNEITYELLYIKNKSTTNLKSNSFIFLPDEEKVYKIVMFDQSEKQNCAIS